MVWTIEYTETAARQLSRLDKPVARRILNYLSNRIAPAEDPRLHGKALVGQLSGLWRYRVGDYRVICSIKDEQLTILVVQLGGRGDIYR